MPISPRDLRSALRSKGWTNVDLAAHWGHSVSYVSWLVNNPHERPRVYEDAFRGLQDRGAVPVVREPRHTPKPRLKKWAVGEMYPVGRVFVTQDNRLGPEEGTDLAVVQVAKDGDTYLVTFEVLSGEVAGDTLELRHGPETDSLADTGQDRGQRLQSA